MNTLFSRIYGCWMGKSIGGTLGLPAEGKTERLYFTFYDPIPKVAPPNDDLELQLVWLHLLETKGFNLTQRDFADAWINHIHYMWDEYGRCRWNLRRGVPIENVGTFENPFHDGMGSPIRSEIWACLAGGNPKLAAKYAAMDASLDHGQEGIDGEVFLSVLQTLVLSGKSVTESLEEALEYISTTTELSRAIKLPIRLFRDGVEAWTAWEKIIKDHGHENFTHAPLNVGLTVWALMNGRGEFEESILLAVNGGYDTDCTAATVGATLGLKLGSEGIPSRWSQPIGEAILIGKGIQGIKKPETLKELTERTLALAEKLKTIPEPELSLPKANSNVTLSKLPGTIKVETKKGSVVEWANGELPEPIKESGGATWIWKVDENSLGKNFVFICSAKKGAKLWVNDQLVVNNKPDQYYMPATHRGPADTRGRFTPMSKEYKIHLELGAEDKSQKACVILASSNLHLATWNGERLALEPNLPSN